jgi:hypothetical protein
MFAAGMVQPRRQKGAFFGYRVVVWDFCTAGRCVRTGTDLRNAMVEHQQNRAV